ncbi:M4 family metallopeptidase [Streptomyces sp. NPDC046821]|uniref:M4 family metallopeptidase n=1 Tax=Streptomyces sp. NPDC046821 TaxID=3154702 RepID=UPI00340C1B80
MSRTVTTRTRTRKRGRGRTGGGPGSRISLGYGVAALLATAGLLLTGVPAAQAAGSAAGDVVPGTDTETPALVTGLDEAAADTGSAADAARGHLAAKKGRYHIADPGRDLTTVDSRREGADETVRLQQKYRGVNVLGGQYVVRMEKKDGQRTVTGTSGRYFTALHLKTTTPAVSEKTAIARAVAAVTASSTGGARLTRPDGKPEKATAEKPQSTPTLAGEAHGLTVLPQGKGVLTRHITVTGTDAVTGEPVAQEVYVDAHSGFPVLQYSKLKTFGTPEQQAVAQSAAQGTAPDAAAIAAAPVVKGEGTRYNGKTAELNLYKGYDGTYQMIDYARTADTSGNPLTTYDARGHDVREALGGWPSGIAAFSSATPEFGQDATDAGAVDAHWAAGQVYDFYRKHFGRDSLDGRGGSISSLVGVTSGGQPYDNAFWDGSKMVYGKGGGNYRTFSASTDVVGHEMTHGVVEHTANLVYAGQSGAMNEALADYFGNAIDVEANGISMSDPNASLLGEGLCVNTAPRDCALRDLDDGHTTSKDFVGISYRGDNGGVHLNSTIFSGSLWDIRQNLNPELADKIVYRALSAYMTPLDGFTQGREAVIAAAQELGVSGPQLNIVKQAFTAHGIVPGWEQALGVDSDTLIDKVNITGTGVGAGGGKFAVSQSNDDGSEPYSVWAGSTDRKGALQQISGNNGNYNVYADTDGKTVVWAEFGYDAIHLKSRPLAGGPEKEFYSSWTGISSLAVDGDIAVFTESDPYGNQHVGYRNLKTGQGTWVDGGRYYMATAVPSVRDGVIAYGKMWPETDGYKLGVETLDLATGKRALMPGDPAKTVNIGQTAVTNKGVFWMRDTNPDDQGLVSVERAAVDGTSPVTISPESGAGALYGQLLTASDDAVTVSAVPPMTAWDNAMMPKLYQLAPDGKGGPQRVSCNRGDQIFPAADTGKRVLWLDGTTGWTSLVKRDRPAGKC